MTKPLDAAELRVRLRSAERVLRLEADLAERNARLEEAQAVIAQDLQAAAQLQQSLLPTRATMPPGYACAWLFEPCAVVGGDVFNYAQIDDDHLALYLLDVAGHGIPAAMLSMMVSKLMRPDVMLAAVPDLIETALHPPRLLRRLNERFQEADSAMQYFTMLYGTLRLSDGLVTLGQAGHPPALHLDADGTHFIGRGGFPVGMLPDLTYDADEVRLAPGDRLVLYSDGVVECRSPDGEPFGADRLADWFDHRRDRPLRACTDALTATLVEWSGGTDFDDDLTLFAIERT
jgi:sigma-B regulation protein RsbU (phosphoserine phosphatase)